MSQDVLEVTTEAEPALEISHKVTAALELETQGAQGPRGEKGNAASVRVGTVTTGAPGSDVEVTNSGDEYSAVFDFIIPRGAVGETGATGPAGAQGIAGNDGAAASVDVDSVTTGAPGTDATVTNVGTTSAARLAFVIPRGATGAAGSNGADGADGAAATIAAGSVTTGAPGSSAAVVNVGTPNAAVFNFTIPRGDVGATGATGATGAQGLKGDKGDTEYVGNIDGGAPDSVYGGGLSTIDGGLP